MVAMAKENRLKCHFEQKSKLKQASKHRAQANTKNIFK